MFVKCSRKFGDILSPVKHLALSENDEFLEVIGNGLSGAKIFAHFRDLDSGLLSESEKMIHSILTGEDHTREFIMTYPLFAKFFFSKSIHLNKSPMVMANLKVLSPAMAQRWGIDVQAQLQHAEHAQALPDMSAIWSEVFDRTPRSKPDVDEDLYGGFLSNSDRRRLNDLRGLTHGQLAHAYPAFEDERLPELLFRYRARNFPEGLSDEEAARWEVHRAERLFDGAGGARTVDQLFDEIDRLSADADERGDSILGALYDYAESIAPHRN